MKLVTLFLLSVTAFGLRTSAPTYEFTEAKVKMDLPNDSWTLAKKQEVNEMAVYIFKRKSIPDNEGREIIPNIGVIIENVDSSMDAINYSVLKRSQTTFEVAEVYTPEKGQIGLSNAIGYKGKYVDQGGLEHTIYIVHAINEKKGIQVICDVTTNVLEKVEGEFLAALKSIRK